MNNHADTYLTLLVVPFIILCFTTQPLFVTNSMFHFCRQLQCIATLVWVEQEQCWRVTL